MRIGVAIASRRRPEDIGNILKLLARQTLPPHRIVLSVSDSGDLPAELAGDIRIVMGAPGLCAQRNRALDALQADCDVVVFYDDDFIPGIRALDGIAALFASRPDIVGATGLVLEDGVCKGSIGLAAALEIIHRFDEAEPPEPVIEETGSTYGCNMAFRMRAVGPMRFDERLALYGWQEDVDFSARMRRHGLVVFTNFFAGVHRGVTGGRSPGRALGYSQMVNPVYLAAKGTMARSYAARLMARNLIANHWRALNPEPHIDRAGRVWGNWAGLFDILKRQEQPEKILGF